jgi:hypothetical protein
VSRYADTCAALQYGDALGQCKCGDFEGRCPACRLNDWCVDHALDTTAEEAVLVAALAFAKAKAAHEADCASRDRVTSEDYVRRGREYVDAMGALFEAAEKLGGQS